MNEKIEITYLEKKEYIVKYLSESEDRLIQRLQFIKILEKNNIKWKEANKLSKLWYNIIFNKCKYNQILYLEVMKYNKMIKN